MKTNLIKYSLILISALFFVNCSKSTESLKITGSDTVLPLSQKEAEEYMKDVPNASISVTGGGSGVGIAALIEGSIDIAQASRMIKFDETNKIEEQGKTLKELIIAYDALAVVVNPKNNVTNLTREQLEDIFTGKITNWSELGGADLKIVPYSRETSSGTYEFFKESILDNKNYVNGIMSMPATGAIIQSVSQTEGAIGYVGLAYINDTVKPVHVSYDGGNSFVAPSFENAKNKSYPVVRPLLYYYTDATEQKVKPFLDFILSEKGQKIVEEIGYITTR